MLLLVVDKNLLNKGNIMSYYITDDCINCEECKKVCPTEAIKKGDTQYMIDISLCASCGLCAYVCPVEAIIEM